MKLYKIGRRYFTLNVRLRQYELLMHRLSEIGIDLGVVKNLIAGGELETSRYIEEGINLMYKLLDGSTMRNIFSIVLVRIPLRYRLPKIGNYLFSRFYRFEEGKIKVNEKYLSDMKTEQIIEVLTDFFTGMTDYRNLSSANMRDSNKEVIHSNQNTKESMNSLRVTLNRA